MNAEATQRAFAVLQGFADASALSKEALTQYKPLFSFAIASPSELFRFTQALFPDEEPFRAEGNKVLWSIFCNSGVAIGNKCSTDDDIAR